MGYNGLRNKAEDKFFKVTNNKENHKTMHRTHDSSSQGQNTHQQRHGALKKRRTPHFYIQKRLFSFFLGSPLMLS